MGRIINPDKSDLKIKKEHLTIDIDNYKGSVNYGAVGETTEEGEKLINKLNHRTFFENDEYYYAKESDNPNGENQDQNCEPYIFSTRGAYDEEKDPKETYSQSNRGIEIGGGIFADNGEKDPNLKKWELNGNVNDDGTDGGGFKYNYGIQCSQEEYKEWAFGNNDMKKANKVINANKAPNGIDYESDRGRKIGVFKDGTLKIDGGTNIDTLMNNKGNEFLYNIGASGLAYSSTYDDSDYLQQLIDENGNGIAGYGKNESGKIVAITTNTDGSTSEKEIEIGDNYNLSNTMTKSYNAYQTVVKPLSVRNLKD